jgi:hypothetical protein
LRHKVHFLRKFCPHRAVAAAQMPPGRETLR